MFAIDPANRDLSAQMGGRVEKRFVDMSKGQSEIRAPKFTYGKKKAS